MGLSHYTTPYVLLKKLEFQLDNLKRNELSGQVCQAQGNTLSVDQRDDLNNKQLSKKKIDVEPLSESDSAVEGEHILRRTTSRRDCFHCKSEGIRTRTYFRCAGCYRSFCKVKPCFNIFHSLTFKSIQDHKAPNPQPASKVTPSTSKVSTSKHVSKSSPSPIKSAIRVSSNGNIQLADGHTLTGTLNRQQCVYCKQRARNKCLKCDKYFCRFSTSGRECFHLYHKNYKPLSPKKAEENNSDIDSCSDQMDEDIDSCSDQMDEDIDQCISTVSDVEQVSDDASDVEITSEVTEEKLGMIRKNHLPIFKTDTKMCFYCKAKESYWHCKMCHKPLCKQKSGKTCFDSFHSALIKTESKKYAEVPSLDRRERRARNRPNMKKILQVLARKSLVK